MTQPPSGSHRAGPPDPDGPHGASPAGYGGGAEDPARRPRKRTLLPWLIGAAVLLIAGLATLLVVLLDGDDGELRGAEPAAVLTGERAEQPARSSTTAAGGRAVTGGTLDGNEYRAGSATDVASSTPGPDGGGSLPLEVHVGADGAVCDFC